ncbi:type I secretion system permease/ATPase [Anianabacter salinae]|uniref:type I secretion system permease/ATPase n=1 Tax=Anianabacter salinae TaxID=2851023 RepID=UPI00225E50F8|nr:type I secretion system permease/ATPase [Anianabacter salinae]MBV0913854.1 type I secretion system permease/ATPase [Anianabacter salinae]
MSLRAPRTDRDPVFARTRRQLVRWLAWILGFSLFLNLLAFVGPLYMLQIYERVLTTRSLDTLMALTVIAAFLLLAYAALEIVRFRILVRAGLEYDAALSGPLFNRVMRLKLAEPESKPDPLLRDLERVREFLNGPGLIALLDAPWTPLFIIACFLFHPALGLVALVGTIGIFGLAVLNELLTRKAMASAMTAARDASDVAVSALQHADLLQSLGMERAMRLRWFEKRQALLQGQSLANDRSGTILALSRFLRMALQIAILGVGALLVLDQQITPGIMIVASIMMGRALSPVEQAVGQWSVFGRARQSWGRLDNLFARIPEEPARTALPKARGYLDVMQLSARVPGSANLALRGITFSVAPGECLAVLGASGSGKTTLLRHLAGSVLPAGGSVRLDGTELSHWPPQQLGALIGYMPQASVLFPGTVAQNMGRFLPEATDKDIVAAAYLAGAYDMIKSLPNGFETEVGPGGDRLSGGQRQRIALARAVFGVPRLIVLDEPNASLDAAGEEALVRCILALRQLNAAVILSTHRSNLVAASSQVMVLDKGTVQKLVDTVDAIGTKAADDAPAAVAARKGA